MDYHYVQVGLNLTGDQLRNYLEYSFNEWGSWSVYPPSPISYLLKLPVRALNYPFQSALCMHYINSYRTIKSSQRKKHSDLSP